MTLIYHKMADALSVILPVQAVQTSWILLALLVIQRLHCHQLLALILVELVHMNLLVLQEPVTPAIHPARIVFNHSQTVVPPVT